MVELLADAPKQAGHYLWQQRAGAWPGGSERETQARAASLAAALAWEYAGRGAHGWRQTGCSGDDAGAPAVARCARRGGLGLGTFSRAAPPASKRLGPRGAAGAQGGLGGAPQRERSGSYYGSVPQHVPAQVPEQIADS